MTRAQPAPAPLDADPPTPETEAELAAALAQLDRDRAALREQLATMPAQELALLEQDASDGALSALDARKRRTRHQLDRLDIRERELLDRLTGLRDRARLAAWDRFTAHYCDLGGRLVEAGHEVLARHAELAALMSEAGRAGLGTMLGQGFPRPPELINRFALDQFPRSLAGLSRVRPQMSTPPVLCNVRMLKLWTMYRAGDQAGFPAAQAHHLVEAGVAEWTDPLHIPRDPRRDKAPIVGATELELQGAAARAEVQAGRASYVEDFACR